MDGHPGGHHQLPLPITDVRIKGEKGFLCPKTQFLYEVRVAPDLVPVSGDGEVEVFGLMSIPQLKDALARGEFTPANGEVVLDFFIPHGILAFKNKPDYTTIVPRLYRSHELTKA